VISILDRLAAADQETGGDRALQLELRWMIPPLPSLVRGEPLACGGLLGDQIAALVRVRDLLPDLFGMSGPGR